MPKRNFENQDLASLIRDRRRGNALSQTELASRVGVSQPLISQWELGKVVPDTKQVERLDAILGGFTESKQADGDQNLPPIAIWLFRALEKKKMTANELARKAGISAPTVYNLLKGGAENPQQRTLKAIEAALDEKFERTQERKEGAQDGGGIGELIDFNPYDPKDLPSKPGVYVFYDISGRPIYVGQSSNIASRLQDHEDKFWVRPPIVQTAAYVEIPDKTTRVRVETVLIQFLKNNAVLNKKKTARDLSD
jgi:transcriptional regulator with XRE-family HTH domain